MGTLSRFLPPFAADYSGAASVFFGSGALQVIIDPGCCTYSYVDVEERRWREGSKGLVSAQLRTIDTVLGADEAILSQVQALARQTQPPFIVLYGTPVPALVGMDVQGLAAEAADACGIPALGIETTGFSAYDQGIRKAYDAALRAMGDSAGAAGRSGSDEMPRIGLLGCTFFDYGTQARIDEVAQSLESAGAQAIVPFSAGSALAGMDALATCDALVAASASALPLARKLGQRHGIPLIAGVPAQAASLASCMQSAAGDPFAALRTAESPLPPQKRVLVVAEQLMAHALTRALVDGGCAATVQAASFFSDAAAARELGTICLKTEDDLARLLEEGGFDALVGDPLLLQLPEAARIPLRIPWVHRAISGHLFESELGPSVHDELQGIANCVCDELA